MLLFIEWWTSLERMQQVFWSASLVSGFLLFIYIAVSLFGFGAEGREVSGSREKKRRLRPTEPLAILSGLTIFSWTALVLLYAVGKLQLILLISTLAGFAGSLLPWLLSPLFYRPKFDADEVLLATGEVLQSVPPHRNGFGKVHLNHRAAPFEMDAVTAGEELPAGAPVRIVGLIDDHVLLVEPLDQRQGPGHPGGSGIARGPSYR